MAEAEYGADCLGADERGSWDGGENRHDHRVPELEMQIGVAEIGPQTPRAAGSAEPDAGGELLHLAPAELAPPLGDIALRTT